MIDNVKISEIILSQIQKWELRLQSLTERNITDLQNSQGRNIRQIIGHMIDSASNNTHRIIHLQYQKCPYEFPNYATFGNNDRWIAIQNYSEENWEDLVNLWKYNHLHILHVIKNINPEMHSNEWISGFNKTVTLQEMIEDFPRHFNLHISEIESILDSSKPNP